MLRACLCCSLCMSQVLQFCEQKLLKLLDAVPEGTDAKAADGFDSSPMSAEQLAMLAAERQDNVQQSWLAAVALRCNLATCRTMQAKQHPDPDSQPRRAALGPLGR
jgi:hypothetical protein